MKNLLKRIEYLLSHKSEIPECFEGEQFMYYWCGKCRQKDYELPNDLKEKLILRIAEGYKVNNYQIKD